jgi:prolyl 4-hydroxylase
MQTDPPWRQAQALAAQGQVAEAADLLGTAVAGGDATAAFLRGLWRFEGRLVPRDLAGARADIAAAADAGSRDAARAHAALLANGAGAEPDWPAALTMLDAWAERDPVAARQRALIAAMDLDADGAPRAVPAGEPLAPDDRVVRLPGLFSADECRFLMETVQARLQPAKIFHEQMQRFVRHPIRDSDAAGFPLLLEWPAVHALNRRIAAASATDVAQGETLQILRYGPGQQYKLHLDAMPELENQRVLTVIVYLNDDYEGGETAFPELGISVKGRRGDGLLFRNALPDGRPDPRSSHAGCPVGNGQKWIASRWIRQSPPTGADGFGPEEVESGRRSGGGASR